MFQIPHNKKIVYDKIVIDAAAGVTAASASKRLLEGTCIGVKLAVIKGNAQTEEVNLSVTDGRGDAVVTATHYNDYITSGGGYLGNLKPATFSTRANIKVDAVCEAAGGFTEDFKAQMIFAILIDNC